MVLVAPIQANTSRKFGTDLRWEAILCIHGLIVCIWTRVAVRIVRDIENRHLRMRIRVRVTGSGRRLRLQLVERAEVDIRTGAGPKIAKMTDLFTGWARPVFARPQPSR